MLFPYWLFIQFCKIQYIQKQKLVFVVFLHLNKCCFPLEFSSGGSSVKALFCVCLPVLCSMNLRKQKVKSKLKQKKKKTALWRWVGSEMSTSITSIILSVFFFSFPQRVISSRCRSHCRSSLWWPELKRPMLISVPTRRWTTGSWTETGPACST